MSGLEITVSCRLQWLERDFCSEFIAGEVVGSALEFPVSCGMAGKAEFRHEVML